MIETSDAQVRSSYVRLSSLTCKHAGPGVRLESLTYADTLSKREGDLARVLSTALLLLALGLAPVYAETFDQLKPVDQAVADLDLLSTSMRRVEVGLRVHGEQTSLFRPPVTHTLSGPSRPQYYRVGPGYVARVDRMDYLVPRPRGQLGLNQAAIADGRFIEIIPANTVFDLRPINRMLPSAVAGRLASRQVAPLIPGHYPQIQRWPGVAAPKVGTKFESPLDLRIDPRIDMRVDPRRDTRINMASHAPVQNPRRTIARPSRPPSSAPQQASSKPKASSPKRPEAEVGGEE